MDRPSSSTTVKTETKMPIVVTSMKSGYVGQPVGVTHHFTAAGMEVQGLSISIDEAASVSTDMVVSVEEQAELEDTDIKDVKHVPDRKKKSRVYSQKFRKSWKELPEFEGWLSEGNAHDKAYCVACNKELVAGKSELLKHAGSKRHKRRYSDMQSNISDPIELSNTIDEPGLSHTLRIIDLRSDTVTRPSKAMKDVMYDALVGDDVFQEDPTVTALERKVAALLEKEAALYVPSGTMANLICVLAHCWDRGSEVIVGDESHLHQWAQGGIAQVGGVHHRTIKNLPDGTFSLSELRTLIRDNNPYFPVTTLVCIENTHNMKGGKALPLEWLDELGEMCHELNLPLHVDGARLMNASVALGMNPSRLVASCDSVALCLNKGLGAPMGSLVVGTKDFIARALRIRKVLGGGLHQCGMMAAAGIFALDHVVPRLAWDHSHARAIAQSVSEEHSSAVTVELKGVQTNVVLLQCDNIRVNAKKLCQRLEVVPEREYEDLGEKIAVLMMPISDSVVRFMTHCDIKKEDVKAVCKKLKYVIQEYDNMMYLEYKINV
ncbi:uncharacterized protein [Macrobrachium rosenbergii]|uniref:uncharacterized protein isoform X2 n=1 Tax=Macrobrachium rosenbergii TaxID=79674 RepID=UPI0034D582AA